MNTIKIYLAESGRIADLKKDFPLYQYQFQNKLLNVFVPTSILAPAFTSQSESGTVLADYVASTSVKIGMSYVSRDGSIKVSKNYYMRYLKTLTYQNVEYALYERKLPKEFTLYAGQGANSPILTANVVNIQQTTEDGTPTILSVITSQTCNLDVMPSTNLDNDEAIEPTELENINAQINEINEILPLKQDKVDYGLETENKSVVGAINENKSKIDTNTTNIGTNTDSIAKNRTDIDFLLAKMQLSENYIGQLSGATLPTNEELTAFVRANISREPRNGDVIIFIQQIEGETDKNYKYFYSDMNWQHYEIPPIEPASNGSLGVLKGTYSIGSQNDTLIDISGGEILNIYVKDSNDTYRNIVEYFNSNTTTSEEIQAKVSSIEDAVAMLDSDVSLLINDVSDLKTADTQNVKITGNQVINGIKNFVGTLQLNGDDIRNVIGDLAIAQQIELGADGIIESNNITYTVQNAEDYLPYRTNLRKFVLNLHLPVAGEVTSTFPVNITFGDTTYYVYNIINNARITWADLVRNTSQSAEGFSTIIEATLLVTADLTGFYIILPDMSNYYTKTETDTLFSNLIGGAPEEFDTLKEIADWIKNDETGTTALINRVSTNETNIADLQTNKVDNTTLEDYYTKTDLSGRVIPETQYSNYYKFGDDGLYIGKSSGHTHIYNNGAHMVVQGDNKSVSFSAASLCSLSVSDYSDSTKGLKRLVLHPDELFFQKEYNYYVGSIVRAEDDSGMVYRGLTNNSNTYNLKWNFNDVQTQISGNDLVTNLTGTNTLNIGKVYTCISDSDSGEYKAGHLYLIGGKSGAYTTTDITPIPELNDYAITMSGEDIYTKGFNKELSSSKYYLCTSNYTIPDGTGRFVAGEIYTPNYTSVGTKYVTSAKQITVNGELKWLYDVNFYAPTTAGTEGYYLKSNGSGAPVWAELPSSTLTIDTALSTTSTNPVQNAIITNAVNNIINNTTLIANSEGGASVGTNAISTLGGAVGSSAKSTSGFSGGYNAKSSVDSVQLGTGTNSTEKTLQVYNDNIYNADTHTLTVLNITLNGNDLKTILDDKVNQDELNNAINSAITTTLNTEV